MTEDHAPNKPGGDKTASERIYALETAISTLKKDFEKPFYKDARFWSGLATVPGLILGGWLIDWLTPGNDAALLSVVHGGLGTHASMSHRLRTDDAYRAEVAAALAREIDADKETLIDALISLIPQDRYRDPLVATIADAITPGQTDLPEAMRGALDGTFMLSEGFTQHLDEEIGRRTNVLRAAGLTLGNRDVDSVEIGLRDDIKDGSGCFYAKHVDVRTNAPNLPSPIDIDPEACPVRYGPAASTHETILFVAQDEELFDVTLGIQVKPIDEGRILANEPQDDVPFETVEDVDDFLKVTLQNDALNPFLRSFDTAETVLGNGTREMLRLFTSRGNSVPRRATNEGFPLQALSIDLLEGMENHAITLAIVISRTSHE